MRATRFTRAGTTPFASRDAWVRPGWASFGSSKKSGRDSVAGSVGRFGTDLLSRWRGRPPVRRTGERAGAETDPGLSRSDLTMELTSSFTELFTVMLILVGLRILATPLLGPPRGLFGIDGRPGRTGSLASFLAFAMVYRFAWQLQEAGGMTLQQSLGVGVGLLVGMAILRWVEILVSCTALTIFVVHDAFLNGGVASFWFAALLLFHLLLRWVLGRA